MVKDNIDKALDKMSLNDLTPVIKTGSVSNLIDPTEAMAKKVIDHLLDGKSFKFIKLEVTNNDGKRLSYGQIKEIELRKNNKYDSLYLKANPIEEVK